MIKKFENYKNEELYDINKHLKIFRKLWSEKSGELKWYNTEPHWTTRNIYNSDHKGVHLSKRSYLLNEYHRSEDNADREDGVNREFLEWLEDNRYKYYWHNDEPYSWSGILIIPPEYTEYNKTLDKFGL